MPSALLDQFPDALEQLRFEFFHPAVAQSFIMIEYKMLIFFTKICGYAKGGKRFGQSVFPVPQPYGIEVAITGEVYF